MTKTKITINNSKALFKKVGRLSLYEALISKKEKMKKIKGKLLGK